MSDEFTTQSPGRVRRDKEPSTQISDADLTGVQSSEPHLLTFKIKNSEGQEIASWALKYGTRDAADSQRADIREEIKHMRGEPTQAWADIARMSKCPYAPALAQYQNLEMDLVPVRQRAESEGLKPGHPAYHGSFAEQRDLEAQRNNGGSGGDQPRTTSPRHPVKGSGGADSTGGRTVRGNSPKTKSGVPAKRSGAKANKGKAKQSPTTKSKRRRPK